MFKEPQEEPPKAITRGGYDLICPHCRNDRFYERSWLLQTPGMTLLDLDWLNSSALNYVCSNCGRIEWFTTPEGDVSAFATTDGDTECLSCGEVIPHGEASCAKCGWTYVR